MISIVTTVGGEHSRESAQLQAGEPLEVTLTLPNSAAGNVSLRWWRTGDPAANHAERLAGTAEGIYAFVVSGAVTRYLDGNYHWALWWEPTAGEQHCLMPASMLYVSISGGFADADPDSLVGPPGPQGPPGNYEDDWSSWSKSDQSETGTDYVELPLEDLTGTWVYEIQLDLVGATRSGWYTRYHIVRAGDPDIVGSDTSSAVYTRTGLQYTGATYTVVTVGEDHFLRFVLNGTYETLTTRVVRWRTRQL